MHFGVVTETWPGERRVALTPGAARGLVAAGHTVVVEAGAGVAAGAPDDEYIAAGASVAWNARDVASQAEVLVKVRPPEPDETHLLVDCATIAAFLRLSAAGERFRAVVRERAITALDLDLIEDGRGGHPVVDALADLSGRLAVTVASRHLLVSGGGLGRLLGGCPGIPPRRVVVLGAGPAGRAAAAQAWRAGAQVVVVGADLRALDDLFHLLPGVATAGFGGPDLGHLLDGADVLIGAVATVGKPAPRLVERRHLRAMRAGAVFVDLDIESGGCAETSRPTQPDEPAFEAEGVHHVCIPDLASELAATASELVSGQVLPYLVGLGALGVEAAVARSGPLHPACVFLGGKLRHPAVAAVTGEPIDL